MTRRPTLFCLAFAVVLIASPIYGGSAKAAAPVQVQCAGDRSFLLRLAPRRARIAVEGRQFDLQRKPSSLGRHYRSADATLIIDGDFVAFVPRDDLDWQDCHIAGDTTARSTRD